jgi:hypothetical protein
MVPAETFPAKVQMTKSVVVTADVPAPDSPLGGASIRDHGPRACRKARPDLPWDTMERRMEIQVDPDRVTVFDDTPAGALVREAMIATTDEDFGPGDF